MNTQAMLDPKSWAEQTFGGVQLHDRRRTRRTVQAASSLAENPLGSLPAQMHTWKETKALYRLLDEPDVTFAALMHPHFQQTRQQANASAVVLLVQDTTDIDLSHRRKISGVGQIGNERGRGFLVQTVLAVRPQTREVLGWMRQVHAIGTPEPGSMWVRVGDRGADMFPFFQACQATQTHFLVRAAQNRRVQQDEDEISYSLTQARSWPSQASRPFEVPARHGHPRRWAHLQLSFGQMTLLPPRHEPRASKEPLTVWIIRVWEEQAPRLLATSVPTTTLEQAWERVDWYRHRWLVEDYHQCLKSGCRIEERQLQSVDGLIRLLAQRCGQSPATMTVGTFWTEVARLGGYLARSHDGPPGWRTIWKGWLSLQTLLEGVHLAFHLRL